MKNRPVEWYDGHTVTSVRKIHTQAEHGIPGLRMFGYNDCSYADSPLPLHYHKNCFEFHYIIKGNLTFTVGDQSYTPTGGDLFITLPDEIHHSGDKPFSPNERYWFQLEIDDGNGFLLASFSSCWT